VCWIGNRSESVADRVSKAREREEESERGERERKRRKKGGELMTRSRSGSSTWT
jgi:hypothetical protein